MTGKGRKGRKLEEWERITLRNLERGMVVKNYPALCRLLNIDVRTGDSKNSQINWLREYVAFVQEGHKFLIKDVYYDKEIKPRRGPGGDNLDRTHIKYIESLLLHILSNSEQENMLVSKTVMLGKLGLINDNYGYSVGNPAKLSKYLDVDRLLIDDWRSSVNSTLVSAVDRALSSLESQSWIFWTKRMTVYEDYVEIRPDGKRYKVQTSRIATDEEIKRVLSVERAILDEMNCENKGVIILLDRWNEFRAKVINELVATSNIKNYWDSYSLIYNLDNVKRAANKRGVMELKEEELLELKDSLASYIDERVLTNAERRHEHSIKAIGSIDHGVFGEIAPERIDSVRSDSSYVSHCTQLNKMLLSLGATDITSSLSDIN